MSPGRRRAAPRRFDLPAASSAAMYVAYVLAGFCSIALPPTRAVAATLPGWAQLVWGVFFVAGGAVCLAGVIWHRKLWWGLMVGLPLLLGAVTTYSGAVILVWLTGGEGSYLFLGVLLLASAAGLVDRMSKVTRRFKAAIADRPPDEVSARRRS